jgi:hypothetical protein
MSGRRGALMFVMVVENCRRSDKRGRKFNNTFWEDVIQTVHINLEKIKIFSFSTSKVTRTPEVKLNLVGEKKSFAV